MTETGLRREDLSKSGRGLLEKIARLMEAKRVLNLDDLNYALAIDALEAKKRKLKNEYNN